MHSVTKNFNLFFYFHPIRFWKTIILVPKEPRVLSFGFDNTRVHYSTLFHELKQISNTPRLWLGMKKNDNVLHGRIFVAEFWGWRYLDEYFFHNSWFNHNILNNLLCTLKDTLTGYFIRSPRFEYKEFRQWLCPSNRRVFVLFILLSLSLLNFYFVLLMLFTIVYSIITIWAIN